MNGKLWLISATALFLTAVPIGAAAGPCDAYFNFDGTLADASGNGYDGEMIVKGGDLSTPVYTEGKFGRALMLDGNAAMRALLDLHYDACPQVTISAWIKVSRDAPGSLHVLSTGGGSGPGLNVSGTGLNLLGTENGIYQPQAVRKGSWMFVAGVYDYAAGTYELYGGSRSSIPGILSASRYEPQNAFWVGTVHDDWGVFARGVAIDDLRITGRKLDQPAVMALSTAPSYNDPAGDADNDSGDNVFNPDRPPDLMPGGIRSDSVPLGIDDQGQPIFASDFVGPSCDSQNDCAASTYCGWDQMCHPETHAPMQALDPIFVPAGVLLPLPEEEPEGDDDAVQPTGHPRPVGAGILTGVSGEESKTTKTLDLVNNFLVGIAWDESGNRPCTLSIEGDSEAMGTARLTETLVGCGDTDILLWDGTSQVRLSRPPSSINAAERGIHYLVVCSNNKNNQRMKGIQVFGHGVDASGSRMAYSMNDDADRSGCSIWQEAMFCDASRIGTGVVIHYTRASGYNEQIVGLQLICRRIGLENE